MRSGFSLVELSIVLVILGLLTGGILTGQSLIRAAELRSSITSVQKYQTAVMTFRDKYFALPGDMPNAVDFWGAAAGGTARGVDSTCFALTTASTDKTTCNGNGDGNIDLTVENFRAWQHLANAGLVEGTYTGVADPAGANLAIPGKNVPELKMATVGATLFHSGKYNNDSGSWFKHEAGNLFSIGKAYTSNETRIGFMLPEEAWNIDKKIDDGKPALGFMMSSRTADCTTTLVAETAEYKLDGDVQSCIFRFWLR